MLNKQKGNMYGFVTHTWNAIKGKCPHDCEYCYMKVFPQGKLRFDKKELNTNLEKGNFIFVGSSCDMFADGIPDEWIINVLNHCSNFYNTYLFQTKNPERFKDFKDFYPADSIFGSTIETNQENNLYKAPPRSFRLAGMNHLFLRCKRKMITIEPIMDFDINQLVNWIKHIRPEFVNIGADSKGHNLPEPPAHKIGKLIKELEKFTKVNLKDNLKRIYPNE